MICSTPCSFPATGALPPLIAHAQGLRSQTTGATRMQVRIVAEGSPATREIPCPPGSSKGHPGRVEGGRLPLGPRHSTGKETQQLLGDDVLYLATVGKGFLSLRLSASYSKGERANWDREERRGGRDKAHSPSPILLWRCWGQMAAHLTGAAPSWMHIRAPHLPSCPTLTSRSPVSSSIK